MSELHLYEEFLLLSRLMLILLVFNTVYLLILREDERENRRLYSPAERVVEKQRIAKRRQLLQSMTKEDSQISEKRDS